MGTSLKERLPTGQIAPSEAGDIFMYRVGGLSMSVCAPASLEGPAVADAIEQYYPCGGKHGASDLRWTISGDKTFAGGQPNPCVCEESPDRRHWFIEC